MIAEVVGSEVLPDVISAGLKVVFCGYAVGPVSEKRGAYYANPQNAFWRVLHEVGLTDRELAPWEFRSLPAYRLGLTDLVKRVAGMDRDICPEKSDAEALKKKILRFSPEIAAFTGKRAGETFLQHKVQYGLQRETIGNTRIFVLPSPAPTARRYWDESPWRDLACESCK
jgi:double-stranded uracil-DNA glycosylase